MHQKANKRPERQQQKAKIIINLANNFEQKKSSNNMSITINIINRFAIYDKLQKHIFTLCVFCFSLSIPNNIHTNTHTLTPLLVEGRVTKFVGVSLPKIKTCSRELKILIKLA